MEIDYEGFCKYSMLSCLFWWINDNLAKLASLNYHLHFLSVTINLLY